MNLATTTHNGRDEALATLTEKLRVASSVVHDAVTFRNLRELRKKVANIQTVTRDIRHFTERIEDEWDSFSLEWKRQLYALAVEVQRPRDDDATPVDARIFSVKGLYVWLFHSSLSRVIDDAEDAIFWFADEIFDRVESEAPEVQAMLGARLETVRTEASLREHDRVGAS